MWNYCVLWSFYVLLCFVELLRSVEPELGMTIAFCGTHAWLDYYVLQGFCIVKRREAACGWLP